MNNPINRRSFISTTAAALTGGLAVPAVAAAPERPAHPEKEGDECHPVRLLMMTYAQNLKDLADEWLEEVHGDCDDCYLCEQASAARFFFGMFEQFISAEYAAPDGQPDPTERVEFLARQKVRRIRQRRAIRPA